MRNFRSFQFRDIFASFTRNGNKRDFAVCETEGNRRETARVHHETLDNSLASKIQPTYKIQPGQKILKNLAWRVVLTVVKIVQPEGTSKVLRLSLLRCCTKFSTSYLFFVWEPVWEPGIWFQFGFGLDLGLPGDSVLWINTPPHLPISAGVPSMFRAHEFSPSV